MFEWLVNKGLAGDISRDLCKKYIALKRQHPSESEKKILKRVWNLWLTLNEEAIIKEDDIDKIVRLDIMKEDHSDTTELDKLKYWSLMDLFTTILYIETEISIQDKHLYNTSLKVFLKNAKRFELDFTNDYEFSKRFLKL